MWETVGRELLHRGLPGIVIMALAWAYWKKDQELTAVQKARIEDAKAVTTVVVDVNDKNRQASEAVRATMAAQTPVILKLEELMRDVKDRLPKK